MLLKYQDPTELEIYRWIAICKTDFAFATKIFDLLGNGSSIIFDSQSMTHRL